MNASNSSSSSNVLAPYPEYLQILRIVNIIINTLLALSAVLTNSLIIATILKSQNLQTPSYLMITSLAFTDFFIGLILHPVLVTTSVLKLTNRTQTLLVRNYEISLLVNYSTGYLILVSTCMNALLSMDRYLALSLRHRYRIHVTKKRVRVAIVTGWVVVFLVYMFSIIVFQPIIIIGTGVLLLVVTFAFYVKSFFTLHRYTLQVQAQQPNPLHGNFDVVKYRRTLKTMVAIACCYLTCCLPGFISIFFLVRFPINAISNLTGFMINMVFLIFGANSSINPVIYLTRFRDIRQEYKKILKRLTCR